MVMRSRMTVETFIPMDLKSRMLKESLYHNDYLIMLPANVPCHKYNWQKFGKHNSLLKQHYEIGP